MAKHMERCIPTPYVLHKKKSVSDVCESGYLEYIYPKNELQSPTLEFDIKGDAEHLIIPSGTYMKLALDLIVKSRPPVKVDKDDVPIPDYTRVSVVNNLLHSYFESVKVQIGGEPIGKIDRNYAYRAYMITACNYGSDQHDSYFKLSNWEKDTAGQMEECSKENEGWEIRRKAFVGVVPRIEMVGKIFSPIFFQNKVLPTQVEMRISLDKKIAAFYMMYDDTEFEFDLSLREAILMIQKVAVVPGLKQSYIDLLEENNPIPYHLSTPIVTHYSIEANTTEFVKDDMFQGKLPNKVVLAMVETEAYHGNVSRNPFNFQHFGLLEACIYKDGIPYPRPMIRLDIENGKYAEAYHHFMTSLNAAYTRVTPNIYPDDYVDGYFMIGYNMSPDQLGSVHPSTLVGTSSNSRLELKFKKPLTKM